MYRPTEVYLGFPHHLLGKQTDNMSEHYHQIRNTRKHS